MGAATAEPDPPFSIITDAIYLGLSKGAYPTKTEWSLSLSSTSLDL